MSRLLLSEIIEGLCDLSFVLSLLEELIFSEFGRTEREAELVIAFEERLDFLSDIAYIVLEFGEVLVFLSD